MPMIRKTIPKKKPKNPITPVTNAPANSPPAAPATDVSSPKKITVNSMLEIGSKKQRMEALINNRFHACFEEFDLIEIIKEIEQTFVYELPKKLIGIIWKGKFRGQKQKWFITRFLGSNSEINIKTKNPEFIEWKWIKPEKLPDVIVDFKKDIYVSLLKEINLIID